MEEAELKAVKGREFPKEKDLSGHLSNKQGEDDALLEEASQGLVERDFQLYEALNLLKALAIVGKVTQ